MSLFGSEHWMYSSGGAFYDTEIDGSLRFNRPDSAYLSRTPSSASNRRTWTFSCWYKPTLASNDNNLFSCGTGGSDVGSLYFQHGGSNSLYWYDVEGGALKWYLITTQVFRDPSAWYHVVAVVDTTNATTNDRVRLYINGERVTSLSTNTQPSQNYQGRTNDTKSHNICGYLNGNTSNAYLAEVNFIDGSALDPTSFGETKSGVWIPKEYSGSYGTNGFHLEFAGNANDSSGNGNNWTANNISSHDYVPDSPTNNFATLNPLYKNVIRTNEANYSQGNLRADGVADAMTEATMSAMTGKWYYEARTQGDTMFGWGISGQWAGDTIGDSGVQKPAGVGAHANGFWLYNGSNIGGTTSFNSGTNIIMFAIDFDNNKIYMGKNGTWSQSGDPGAGTGGQALPSGIRGVPLVPAFRITNSASDFSVVNFGQDSSFAGGVTAQGNTDANGIGDFYYSVPSGFKAWCTANIELPEAMDLALNKSPEDYFNTVLYTGNGGTLSVSVGFAPDFTWIKNRSNAYNHRLYDKIRGNSRTIQSNQTNAESTYGAMSFESDGFAFTNDPQQSHNTNGDSYVAWNWKANGSGVSNTDGSITSTVSANTDAGFSIVSYTGTAANATVGHGLDSAPDMFILKNRDATGDWYVYHSALGATKNIRLNLDSSAFTTSNLFNDTEPTSTTFSLGFSAGSNGSGSNYIAYCFHSVEGFSKIGVYEANQNSFGMFINTGFEPAFVMYKNIDRAQEWIITTPDATGYNPENNSLSPNSSGAEGTGNTVDVVSNGFKIRTSGSGINYANGDRIAYMAFARVPFKYANAR